MCHVVSWASALEYTQYSISPLSQLCRNLLFSLKFLLLPLRTSITTPSVLHPHDRYLQRHFYLLLISPRVLPALLGWFPPKVSSLASYLFISSSFLFLRPLTVWLLSLLLVGQIQNALNQRVLMCWCSVCYSVFPVECQAPHSLLPPPVPPTPC